MPSYDLPELDLGQLKALTHPLRVRMLKELRANGPATATLLAKRLGESTGATSYHLRQLERHGFVAEDAAEGDGRDRWWRPVIRGHTVQAGDWLDDPERREVYRAYATTIAEAYGTLASEYLAHEDEYGREWAESVDMSDFRLRLRPRDLRRLVEAVHKTIERFERHHAADGEDVIVLLQAFPRRGRPFTVEAE